MSKFCWIRSEHFFKWLCRCNPTLHSVHSHCRGELFPVDCSNYQRSACSLKVNHSHDKRLSPDNIIQNRDRTDINKNRGSDVTMACLINSKHEEARSRGGGEHEGKWSYRGRDRNLRNGKMIVVTFVHLVHHLNLLQKIFYLEVRLNLQTPETELAIVFTSKHLEINEF